MPIALDRRTRRDAEVRFASLDAFFSDTFPMLAARHGALVADGARALGAPPLAIEVGSEARSIVVQGDGLAAVEGIVDGAFVIRLTASQFSELIQNQQSLGGLVVARELRCAGGGERETSVWDSLLLALLEGWPVVDGSLEFVGRSGAPLDLDRTFTPEDDPADVAHFIREAGYLHLRGWIDSSLMPIISEDMDRALPHYREGDGKSWWGLVTDGSLRCVRLQEFLEHSPTTEALLRSEAWDAVRRTIAAGDELVQATGPRSVEALIKPVGVVTGPSDVGFHRDCHLGRHAYNCSGTTVGVSLTASGEDNGMLRVVAGSHRLAMPAVVAYSDPEPYLPIVGLPTEPGDLTVHLSCTLHEATPPRMAERRVLYGGNFSLPKPPDTTDDAGAHLSQLRERVYKDLLRDVTT